MTSLSATTIFALSVLLAKVSTAEPFAMKSMDCLLVSNATIVLDDGFKEPTPRYPYLQLNRANDGHEIESGRSNVLAVRVAEDNGDGVDGASFSKLTVELIEHNVLLPLNHSRDFVSSRSYYTDGSAAFIPKGEFWRARQPVKSVGVTRTAAGLTATIKATFLATKDADHTYKDIVVDYTCPVRIVAVSNLGPWEGKKGTTWDSFAPPPK